MENQDEKHHRHLDVPYSIVGPTVFEELSTYTYTLVPGNAYGCYWEVEGGVVTAGQGSDTVTIQWNATSGVITAGVITTITVLDTTVGGKLNPIDE